MGIRPVRRRLREVSWARVIGELEERGVARVPGLLEPSECQELIRCFDDDARFRKRVDMGRHRFGSGDYAYFRDPLPPLVRSLRSELFRRLAPAARRWLRALGRQEPIPGSWREWERSCRAAGQARPTPLLLRYGDDGYNCLHQDLYGEIVYPFQATFLLSDPRRDFHGGEFLLVENRPRQQSRGEAFALERGEMIVFPVRERPVRGKRGTFAATVRHGLSRVRRGQRVALGIIFHLAR